MIDVIKNFRPRQDAILIKTFHPRLDVVNVVRGMSGSPIYIDGKMIGAYAYGWSFGKEPVAGVTPIAQHARRSGAALAQVASSAGRSRRCPYPSGRSSNRSPTAAQRPKAPSRRGQSLRR